MPRLGLSRRHDEWRTNFLLSQTGDALEQAIMARKLNNLLTHEETVPHHRRIDEAHPVLAFVYCPPRLPRHRMIDTCSLGCAWTTEL